MNKAIQLTLSLLVLVPLLSLAGQVKTSPLKVISMEKQSMLTPQRALELLQQGNKRFISNTMQQHNYVKQMKLTARFGQYPIAIILTCIDSRSIANILFDQGIGGLFVARVAGNVVDKNILGSMEFATEIAGAPLIVIMGHTNCGAIKGACSGGAQGNLKYLLSAIQPSIARVKKVEGKMYQCDNPVTQDAIAKQNVLDQMQYVIKNSPAIDKLITDKKVELVGAMHDLSTGKVTFFNQAGKSIK